MNRADLVFASSAHSAEASERQLSGWAWNCPWHRKRWIIPDMAGLPSRHDAAHFFSGRERTKIRRTGHGEAVAVVRAVDGLGPSRLLLYKMRGEWYVDQMVVCEREHRHSNYAISQPHPDGTFTAFHSVQVVDGDYRVVVTETVTDAATPDGHQDYPLDSEGLLSMASDRSLVFPEPDPLPPLPSWERCLYGEADVPSSCP